jgi:hypothetical protein
VVPQSGKTQKNGEQCDQTFCDKSAQNCPNIGQNGAFLKKNFLKTYAQMGKFCPIWDRSYDFKNIFAEKFRENIGVFCSNCCYFFKNLIITLVFEKKRQFFRRKL